MPTASQFHDELRRIFQMAEQQGLAYVDVNAGELHRRIGDYPDPHEHRMPTCCNVMRQYMQDGDSVLQAPPKGNGASLTVRYRLPRK